MKKIATILAIVALSACAKSPSSIAPVSMGSAFSGVPCHTVNADLAAERDTLAALESAQKGAVVGDAIGVFLIGVPMSSLAGGDKSGELATSKGKVLALEARSAECRGL